ncbi:MAG: DUF4412 domain-containing protein [Gammaproteobacteria bacterium]|nr:DUF4412 domain-containing protein [Gammaproteobacteria bacterium]
MLRTLPVILLFLLSLAVQADTQITIKDSDGIVSKISSNGKKARMDDKGDVSYAIAHYKSGDFFVVNPDRKEVMSMDMNAMPEQGNAVGAASEVVINLEKKGKGPKIAGYKTKEYELTANDQYCGTIFGSKKLLKKKGVSALFEFINNMRRQSMKMTAAFVGSIDVCEQAMDNLSLSFKKTGAPMRILDARGDIESEVIKVKTKKKLKASYYDIPADYAVVSVADQMDAANQQSQQMKQQMGQNMPDMDELMKQMQGQDGQVSEEILKQMEKMQEMLKQYQQQ